MITPAQGQQHLARAVTMINEMLVTADFAARVPPCPGWTVADLIVHVGETHLWARHAILAGNPEAPDPGTPHRSPGAPRVVPRRGRRAARHSAVGGSGRGRLDLRSAAAYRCLLVASPGP